MKNKKIAGGGVASLMVVLAAFPFIGTKAVWAQDKQSQTNAQFPTLLNKVILDSSRDGMGIDTPQSVTIIDQEQIDEDQPTTMGDLLKTVVGVSASGSNRLLGQTFNMRGIGAPQTGAGKGHVAVNVDGVNKYYEQYRMGGFFNDPDLFKRVEVLRGPASATLNGSGAFGGVINFTTKDASDFLQDGETRAIRLKTGYDTNGKGFNGLGIIALRPKENLEFLAIGNYRRSGQFVTGDGAKIIGSEFTVPSSLLKGTYKFGKNNEQALRLSYQHWTTKADDQNYIQTSDGGDFGTVDREVTDKTAILAYENKAQDIPWLNLKAQLSYSDTTNKQSNNLSDGNPGYFADTIYGYKTIAFKAENTFESIGEDYKNFLIIGNQTSRRERSTKTQKLKVHHPQGTDFRTGLFLQNEFIHNERFTVIAGMRFDHQTLSPHRSVSGASHIKDWTLSPKLALHYKLNENFAIFGSYAHTERFPLLDEVFTSNDKVFKKFGISDFSLNLKTEKSDNFEFGFSASIHDMIVAGDSISFKTTLFHNSIKDLIVRQGMGKAGDEWKTHYHNIGEAKIHGLEAQLGYNSELWFAKAGLSVTRGKNITKDTYLNTVAPDELDFRIGRKLPQYDMRFGVQARFVAAQKRVVPEKYDRQPSKAFKTLNIFASWKPDEGPLKGLELNASIDNIFDKQYKEFLSNNPAKGRSFKISLAKTFTW